MPSSFCPAEVEAVTWTTNTANPSTPEGVASHFWIWSSQIDRKRSLNPGRLSPVFSPPREIWRSQRGGKFVDVPSPNLTIFGLTRAEKCNATPSGGERFGAAEIVVFQLIHIRNEPMFQKLDRNRARNAQ
jgi:hypothetical protein